jgi:uncharacterized protein with gpF-like domain
MKFKAWEAKRNIERQYKTALGKLNKFISDLLGGLDSLVEAQNTLEAFSESPQLDDWANAVAKTMVTHTLSETSRTWRQAAAESGQGNKMYQKLSAKLTNEQDAVSQRYWELIDENAKYIKSVPKDAAEKITKVAAKYSIEGGRNLEDNSEFKELTKGLTASHVELIATTEVSKAHSALIQAQAEDGGHDWCIWHTSEDQRVRKSHVNMDNVMFRYSDKPAPEELVGEKSDGHYGPGEIFRCRCYAQPIIRWQNVSWPHNVYHDNQITMMSKTQFEQQFGKVA